MNDRFVEVDVAPGESGRLTGAQPSGKHGDPQRPVPVVLMCGCYEALNLGDGEGLALRRCLRCFGDLHTNGGVPADPLLAVRRVECHVERRPKLDERVVAETFRAGRRWAARCANLEGLLDVLTGELVELQATEPSP